MTADMFSYCTLQYLDYVARIPLVVAAAAFGKASVAGYWRTEYNFTLEIPSNSAE